MKKKNLYKNCISNCNKQENKYKIKNLSSHEHFNKKRKRVKIQNKHKSHHIYKSYTHEKIIDLPIHIHWPIEKDTFWLSARFGIRKNRIKKKYEMHTGIDLAAPRGTLVKSASSGTIISASYDKGYGNCIVIDHGNGIHTRYAHLQSMAARVGQNIVAGECIGKVGNTGNTRGIRDSSHLHFELIVNKIRYDPLPYLK